MLDTRNAHIYVFDYAVDIPDIFEEKGQRECISFVLKAKIA